MNTTFGHRNELRRHAQQVRSERIQNRMAAVFFVGFIVYVLWGAI